MGRPPAKRSTKSKSPRVSELTQLKEELQRVTEQLKCRERDLAEALEQQTATSEILRIISSSPTDIQPVLDAIAESAARLCDSCDAVIHRVDGDLLQRVARFGSVPVPSQPEGGRPITRGFPMGRAIVDRQTIHVHDILAELDTEFPDARVLQQQAGSRTVLATPLLREGVPIGLINIRRTEVRPFSEKQIALLKTFAAQAVIAIENVRLFQELSEALERQTATSEILGVIASSPTELQRVLDVVAKNAARVCDSRDAQIYRIDGDMMRKVASYGTVPDAIPVGEIRRIGRGSISGRAIVDREAIHIHDMVAERQEDYPDIWHAVEREGIRTALAVPLLREGVPVGAILIRRMEVRPFSEKQIALLKTFADQAVIAIENVRLFQELQARNRELIEALDQQTATSNVLSVIASSPTELQPVLDVVAKSAAQLCDSYDAQIYRVEGDNVRKVASYGNVSPVLAVGETRPLRRGSASGRAILDGQTVHIHDILAEPEEDYADVWRNSQRLGIRTGLAVPLMREGIAVGAITIRRTEVRPFTDKQIALLKTFADQAVIAIENVRLFKELQAKNRDLTEALEQQTATSEILRVIASSPTDLQPVLDAVAENAARLCDSNDAQLRLIDGNILRLASSYGSLPTPEVKTISHQNVTGRAVIDRQMIHIHDLETERETEYPDSERAAGGRTVLAIPLLREDTAIGAILIRRVEVQPFTDKQIALLKTFADQAVIAIANVRLFQELQERNAELREALEHQTATAEVLSIISRSPTDVQPVLDAIVESAARVCGIDDVVLRLRDDDVMVARAHFGPMPNPPTEIGIDAPEYRWVREHGTLHISDVRTRRNDFPTFGSLTRFLTFLVAPLRQHGEFIGSLNARRTDVRPFTPVQIKLLETFADQAVIAIENVRLFQELKEALEQQTATSEILRVISSSPTDVQPVMNAIVASAARLCAADDVHLHRVEGDGLRHAASFGGLPAFRDRAISAQTIRGRAVLERKTIHVPDVAQLAGVFSESGSQEKGARTALVTPLIREGVPIGVIGIRRMEVRPFSEKQIKLLETFADQAVIAIENVRLFQEIQDRNAELREALEHQTATAEVLGIISRSPTNVQPVLDAIVESAARVCGIDDVHLRLRERNSMVVRAHFGPVPMGPAEISIDAPAIRWVREHGALHIPDVRAQNEIELLSPGPLRTFLSVPLHQQAEVIGALTARRVEVRPFTPAQIKLLETFADQAVIALENVRLFQELKEALEQQTATSKILGVIASSATDLQPVLDTIAESAAQVCNADDAVIRLAEGDQLSLAAHHGPIEPDKKPRPINRGSVVGRAILDRQVMHITDLLLVTAQEFPVSEAETKRRGVRTVLAAPLLRENQSIGVILIRRTAVNPFTEKQVALLETFADQAVIAIENVRLFQELQTRNRELTEALEQQTATSEILRVISSSPTDLQPVMATIAENAARLCDSIDAQIYRVENDVMRRFASWGQVPVPAPIADVIAVSRDWVPGRAVVDRQTIHLHDIQTEEVQAEYPLGVTYAQRTGVRTVLGTPLLREGVPIGAILIRRLEVRPFTDKQIALLKTFADQAVIAIENVRLFQELQAKNRDLTEALEQQTATSQILQVIASSPTELQPVLDTIAESAVRVCNAEDAVIRLVTGTTLRVAAHYGSIPIVGLERPLDRLSISGRVVLDSETIHVEDALSLPEAEFPESHPDAVRLGVCTNLGVPLMRKGQPIGVIFIRRMEVRPFSEKQIALLKTFADQAVIAIENVRLFQELQARTRELSRSVEHLTALGEVGRAVSSTLDLETVLTTIVTRAVQLSGTSGGVVYEYDSAVEEFHLRATHGMDVELSDALEGVPIHLGEGSLGQAALARAPVQVPNILDEQAVVLARVRPILVRSGYRSVLALPFLFEEQIVGGLVVWRRELGGFPPEVVNLLQTFAIQSVLAMQNARLFREIEDKSQQLEIANRHKSAFLANMSHELRTPLNAIIGFSQVLLDPAMQVSDDERVQFLTDIFNSGKHLLNLINEVLDLSKIEAGKMELQMGPVSLQSILEAVNATIRPLAAEKGIALDAKDTSDIGPLYVDAPRIKQVLLNLVGNAIKFTPREGQVWVRAFRDDGFVRVEVGDTGPGIAAEDHERIFLEFQQAGTESGKPEGTGLGLALARKFVEMHGGEIWVESKLGKGSRFFFTIPVS
jgi:GAF domain-containing protein